MVIVIMDQELERGKAYLSVLKEGKGGVGFFIYRVLSGEKKKGGSKVLIYNCFMLLSRREEKEGRGRYLIWAIYIELGKKGRRKKGALHNIRKKAWLLCRLMHFCIRVGKKGLGAMYSWP